MRIKKNSTIPRRFQRCHKQHTRNIMRQTGRASCLKNNQLVFHAFRLPASLISVGALNKRAGHIRTSVDSPPTHGSWCVPFLSHFDTVSFSRLVCLVGTLMLSSFVALELGKVIVVYWYLPSSLFSPSCPTRKRWRCPGRCKRRIH